MESEMANCDYQEYVMGLVPDLAGDWMEDLELQASAMAEQRATRY